MDEYGVCGGASASGLLHLTLRAHMSSQGAVPACTPASRAAPSSMPESPPESPLVTTHSDRHKSGCLQTPTIVQACVARTTCGMQRPSLAACLHVPLHDCGMYVLHRWVGAPRLQTMLRRRLPRCSITQRRPWEWPGRRWMSPSALSPPARRCASLCAHSS